MKRLVLFIAFSLSLHAVGTVQQSFQPLGLTGNWVLAINWTGDAITGAVPVTTIQFGLAPVQGFRAYSLEVAPGTPAPTNLYNVTLTTFLGDDILLGGGLSLSSTAATSIAPAASAPPLNGSLTLTITGNSVGGAKGRLLVYFAPVSQVVTLSPAAAGLSTNNTFTGTNTFTDLANFANIAVVDGSKYLTIQAAINSFASNPGIVLIPSNYTTSDTCAGCTIPQNVILWDLRSTQNPVIGNNTVSYNVNSAQTNISTSLIRASQQVVAPTKSGAASINYGFYSGSMAGANGQSLEGENGGVQIYGTPTNLPGSLFVIGAENFAQLNTTGTGVTFPDLRGSTNSVQLLSPNTSSVTRASSVYGQACTVGGTGTIGTCVSGYFELPSAATGVNEAFHAEGQSSFGGSPSSPRIILDRASTGVINIIGGTSDPVLGGNGHIFWRTDLSRFRGFDGSTWRSFAQNVIPDTLRETQFVGDQGSVCTNGELALSAGWQSTGSATVTAVAGNGQTCSWTITTGTTTAANPTVTDTLTNVLPAATTVCEMNIHGGTHTAAAGEGFQQTTLSATAPIFTFNGTPTAGGTTYFVTRRCGP